jgi:DNA polymerase/3'-5' exonuclease PolX
VIAAVFIDGGYAAAERFVVPLVLPVISNAADSGHQQNFKSVLQQWAQQHHTGRNATPVYRILDEQGPDHAKCFKICVEIAGKRFEPCSATKKKAGRTLVTSSAGGPGAGDGKLRVVGEASRRSRRGVAVPGSAARVCVRWGMALTNEQVAARLEEIGRLLDLLGEDSFKVSAHARAARAVEGLAGSVAEMARDKKALLAIDGVGPKIADKIIELCEKGRSPARGAEVKVPAGLLDVMQVPGLGPKTVRAMWQTLGITDMAGLQKSIDDGTLLTLPRMGEKAVEKIKASMAIAAQGNERVHLGRAWPIAHALATHLAGVSGVQRAEPAGSLRRGRETVGDIDIVVAMKKGHEGDAAKVMEAFRTAPGVQDGCEQWQTSVQVSVGDKGRSMQGTCVVPAARSERGAVLTRSKAQRAAA